MRPADATHQVSPDGELLFAPAKSNQKQVQGENTDSTSGTEVRALAHSIFPLKTPEGYGRAFKECGVLPTGAG